MLPVDGISRTLTLEMCAMYRTILVAVDGSGSSRLALREAVCLAASAHGVVHAVHVVHDAPIFSHPERDLTEFVDAMRREGRSALVEAAQACAAAGVECHAELLEPAALSDDVASIVECQADRLHADLVVMGTHGRRGVRRLVLGSVAERFLRLSKRPVLLMRDDESQQAAT
ncbi:universal stress protein [Paraburkholderia sp. PGU19]|uniref:universal stress protein n=1 Tax=Paraburkholderia sp. PGU19 TaxID=2735434 RepID=UPI0031F824B3